MIGLTRSCDVHQHLWPEPLLEALRRRRTPPYLDGWTLVTAHEPPYDVTPDDHEPTLRSALDPDRDLVLVSLSTPIGVEALPADEAQPLLDAWHEGLCELAEQTAGRFGGWAAANEHEPDLTSLSRLLDRDWVYGLQLSAHQLATPAAVEACAEILQLCERADRPVLVHPGPATLTPDAPDWWPAIIDYPAQLSAAWWAWRVAGRQVTPNLRICFAAGAGLAPAQHERFRARSEQAFTIDANVFVDTSSYGRQGVDALVRALGIDAPVLASDRPYATPSDPQLGAAAWHAISVSNPARLLGAWTEASCPTPPNPPSTRPNLDAEPDTTQQA